MAAPKKTTTTRKTPAKKPAAQKVAAEPKNAEEQEKKIDEQENVSETAGFHKEEAKHTNMFVATTLEGNSIYVPVNDGDDPLAECKKAADEMGLTLYSYGLSDNQ